MVCSVDAVLMPTLAKNNDLLFLERLQEYSAINKVLSDGAMQKHLRHLRNLNEKMICLAMLDLSVTLEVKRGMVNAMKSGPHGNNSQQAIQNESP